MESTESPPNANGPGAGAAHSGYRARGGSPLYYCPRVKLGSQGLSPLAVRIKLFNSLPPTATICLSHRA